MLLQHPNLSFKALRRLTFFRINLVPKNLPSFHQITSSFHCLNAILLPLLLYCFAVMSSFFYPFYYITYLFINVKYKAVLSLNSVYENKKSRHTFFSMSTFILQVHIKHLFSFSVKFLLFLNFKLFYHFR